MYYIYGIFHSKEYQSRYGADLAKSFPRLPNIKNKKAFVEIGKKLANLHLNYEKVRPFDDIEIVKTGNDFNVTKMKWGKMRDPISGKRKNDYSVIIFNNDLIIKGIPLKAYDYQVSGKSAIKWIMDQYQVKERKSGIIDDPNDYSDDPKYIFNLLLSIINVSVQTVDLINQLPKFELDESFYKDDGEE